MYKCEKCGHVFDGSEAHMFYEDYGLPGGFRQSFCDCPNCGSSEFSEASVCLSCGDVFAEDELYAGIYCIDCLRESIDYETGYEFMRQKCCLSSFIFHWFYECKCCPDLTEKLLEAVKERFRRQVIDDQLTGKTEFLELIRDYIIHADGESGAREYADWLKEAEYGRANKNGGDV